MRLREAVQNAAHAFDCAEMRTAARAMSCEMVDALATVFATGGQRGAARWLVLQHAEVDDPGQPHGLVGTGAHAERYVQRLVPR